jgi:AcrR family transcriptional regulator
MRQRAEQVEETRLRITEAAMRLHTTIGPSRTTIAGIADEAGVTRLTVYRHFEDPEAIFVACMGHWAALHPAPDPAAWATEPDLETRARRALAELYAWYAEVGDDLTTLQRDRASIPDGARARAIAAERARVHALVEPSAGPLGPDAAHALRAAGALVLALPTWRTLVREQALSPDAAVELGVRLLLGAAS